MAQAAVDILGINIPYDRMTSRYAGTHVEFIFVLELVERQWVGYITFADVMVWRGEYPTLEILVNRMEAFCGDLFKGLASFVK